MAFIMLRVIVPTFLALAVTLPAGAMPRAAGETPSQVESPTAIETRGTFNPAERNLIRAHLLGRQAAPQQGKAGLPTGLQQKPARGKALPQSWQSRLIPGRGLDYQLYRQGQRLPEDLLRRLSPAAGVDILRIENKIVRLNATTRVILDVFDLAPSR